LTELMPPQTASDGDAAKSDLSERRSKRPG
jgi:hypothetical protein